MADVVRLQMRAAGAHQGLSPVLDIARDPRWGRIEETFGEDPYLVSRMGVAFVQGLQGDDPTTGVAATAKHFPGHGWAEADSHFDLPVDERSETEIRHSDLQPFAAQAFVDALFNKSEPR